MNATLIFFQLASGELRTQGLQVIQHGPEEFLRQLWVTLSIGMGKPVAARSHRATNRGEGPAENPQPIAQIIQRNDMGQLRVEHGHNVAPAGEGACLFVDAGFVGDATDQESWNQIANLTEDIKFVWVLEWFCLFFHLLLVEQLRTHSNAFLIFLWDATDLRSEILRPEITLVRAHS
jgi:hypothetical protein